MITIPLRIQFLKTVSENVLPRVSVCKYNVLIDGRNFYDQPINDLIKQYDEVRKVSTGQGDDCTTRCSLDYSISKIITTNCS